MHVRFQYRDNKLNPGLEGSDFKLDEFKALQNETDVSQF